MRNVAALKLQEYRHRQMVQKIRQPYLTLSLLVMDSDTEDFPAAVFELSTGEMEAH